MESTYLSTFLLVVDSGSMSEAARRLDLTPAAVAQQLQVLERELGGSLLQRVGRTVRPTEAGHRLVGHARAALDQLAHLKAVVAEDDTSIELRVGAINTALHSVLPDVLARLVKAHPQAKVQVRSALSSELYDALQRGELDVAVCLHPPYVLPKTLDWEMLREEPLVVLAPLRWAKRDPLELLRNEPLIRYDRSLGGGKEAERYLQRARIVPRERFELNSLAAIAMLVDKGLGVSLAPDAASPWWPGVRVARIPLPRKAQARRFGMAWQRASVRLRAIEQLLAQTRAAMPPRR